MDKGFFSYPECLDQLLILREYWVSFLGVKQPGVMLTTDLHPVLKLRMSGAIPLLPLYAFMAWTGETLL
jgi:hypothetical protein